MATTLKKCDGECSESGDACSEAIQVCPAGYFCAFGDLFAEEISETECLSGRCVNIDDSTDVLTTSWCSRCNPGYVIVTWKDEYKTNTGKDDCEFVISECPMVCDNGSYECADRSSCNVQCDEFTKECVYPDGNITITCSAEEQKACSESYSFIGEDMDEANSGRPKGTVANQPLKKCCGCDYNLCPGCPAYCVECDISYSDTCSDGLRCRLETSGGCAGRYMCGF